MNDVSTKIGLEVHVQLQTETKLFCSCPNRRNASPNENVCPVCSGLPGTLPSLNKQAIRFGLKAALSLNCDLHPDTSFDRKNYFYPDLPKNYQISQYDVPLGENGSLTFPTEDSGETSVKIERIHLEEDAGKLIHGDSSESRSGGSSLVDLNRTGIPLVEIVTAPQLRTPEQAYRFLEQLKRNIQYTGVSDCSMESGSLRCDANLSVQRPGRNGAGARVEVKNLNSFSNVKKALRYEKNRQANAIKKGKDVQQFTCTYDAEAEKTIPMRSKEVEADYRYFPDPDLPELHIDESLIEEIKQDLPERPRNRRSRFIDEYHLDEEKAQRLTEDRSVSDYFEEALHCYDEPESIYNWIYGEIMAFLNERDQSMENFPVDPEHVAKLAKLFDEDRITSTASRNIFEKLLQQNRDPETIMEEEDLQKVGSDSRLQSLAEDVLEENEEAASDYLNGEENAIQALVGGIMQKTKGKADPVKSKEILKQLLEKKQENP